MSCKIRQTTNTEVCAAITTQSRLFPYKQQAEQQNHSPFSAARSISRVELAGVGPERKSVAREGSELSACLCRGVCVCVS